jgi:hypothetical protein
MKLSTKHIFFDKSPLDGGAYLLAEFGRCRHPLPGICVTVQQKFFDVIFLIGFKDIVTAFKVVNKRLRKMWFFINPIPVCWLLNDIS